MIKGILAIAARNARRKRLGLPKTKPSMIISGAETSKRLPEGLEFLRGYAKRQERKDFLFKPQPGQVIPKNIPIPKYVDMVPLRASIAAGKGNIKNLFRGETLYPDQKYISKTGMESGTGVKPGQWWSAEPLEAATYAIRPSKGIMGIDSANPGVIRRMSVNKNIEDMGDMMQRGTGKTHFHPTQDMIDNSKISLFYSVINRLRELGFKDAKIFKYIGQIMRKKNAAGKRDYMLYNSGGIV